jgi:LytS/YehU family sensor histidine kinase
MTKSIGPPNKTIIALFFTVILFSEKAYQLNLVTKDSIRDISSNITCREFFMLIIYSL